MVEKGISTYRLEDAADLGHVTEEGDGHESLGAHVPLPGDEQGSNDSELKAGSETSHKQ